MSIKMVGSKNKKSQGVGTNKKHDGNALELWLGSAVLGTLMSTYNVGGHWATLLVVAGLIGACIDVVIEYSPYRRLLEGCKLEVDGKVPLYKGKTKTSYGYSLRFTLPPGLSTDDFERKKLAIEQYLKHRVEIGYNNRNVFIGVYKKELDSMYEYNYIPTNNICEFPIGYGYGEKLITVDLEKVVHMLVAGETGSGKSTLLRGILTNIILDKNPRKLGLHLIDLKNGAEFSVFRKSRMVKSFSRTKEEAEDTLIKISEEVDKRYDLFFENNVVDIREYNKLQGKRELDYQIIIIDEFADLQDEKGSISIIETLAAKARACGIHLIISTQRPDAKIINGRIKANIPCVIGLKTMNGLNSRIIIDEEGLEELKGRGHGILKYSNMTEFQAMYLSVCKARNLIKDKYINKPKRVGKKERIGEVEDFGFLKALVGDKE